MLNRRDILGAGLGGGATLGLVTPAAAAISPLAFGHGVLARDFGVIPDIARDQTDRLQRAIAHAGNKRLPLLMDPGRFSIRRLEIDHPVQIFGMPGQTIFHGAGQGPLMEVSDTGQVGLTGLTFDGTARKVTDKNGGLLAVREITDLVIERCTVTGSSRHGIALQRCSGTVVACAVANAGETGLFSNDATGLRLADNDIRDCGNNGIQVWRSLRGEDGTIITGNRVRRIRSDLGGSGQNGNGINIYRAGNVIIANNQITDCAFTAVRSNAGDNCQILGNSCSRLGEVAIYAEFGFEGAVISGNMIAEAAVGVSITNFDRGGRLAVCSGNIVRDLTLDIQAKQSAGTGIFAEADTVVSANVIDNAPLTGIALGWGKYLRNVAATGNVIRNAGIGIAVSALPGAGPAMIANNMISATRNGAVRGMDHSRIITGDLTAGGADIPAHIALTANAVG